MKHAEQTIVDLEKRLEELSAEARKIKSAINCLCEVMKKPLKYEEADEKPDKRVGQRSDKFYGRPLATVVTEVLQERRDSGEGSASLDEIFDQLALGGYQFTGKNDGIKKRGLAISMSKNPKFHKLPNETWGLAAWYPGIKETKNGVPQPKADEQEESTPPNDKAEEESQDEG
jgi:hypothetical protein